MTGIYGEDRRVVLTASGDTHEGNETRYHVDVFEEGYLPKDSAQGTYVWWIGGSSALTPEDTAVAERSVYETLEDAAEAVHEYVNEYCRLDDIGTLQDALYEGDGSMLEEINLVSFAPHAYDIELPSMRRPLSDLEKGGLLKGIFKLLPAERQEDIEDIWNDDVPLEDLFGYIPADVDVDTRAATENLLG